MDRGLASQQNDATPGSVQSAAFNHYNRMKPHMSISNLQPNQQQQLNNNTSQNYNLRESQEDLDGADYDLNDPHSQYQLNPVVSPRQRPEQQQQQTLNNQNQTQNSYSFRTGGLQPKSLNINNNNNTQNLSDRSANFNTNQMQNNNINIQHLHTDDNFDQLDDYYTVSVIL